MIPTSEFEYIIEMRPRDVLNSGVGYIYFHSVYPPEGGYCVNDKEISDYLKARNVLTTFLRKDVYPRFKMNLQH